MIAQIQEKQIRPVEPKSHGEMNADRARRALARYSEYAFAFGEDPHGVFSVLVSNGSDTYFVTESGCDCPDHTYRCAGTPVLCLHRQMVELWICEDHFPGCEDSNLEPLPDIVARWKPVRRQPASSVEEWREPALVVTYAAPSPVARIPKNMMLADFPGDDF